jgi:hypothetical protein
MKTSYIVSGGIGAIITILVFLASCVWLKPFYYVPASVVNSEKIHTDSLTNAHLSTLNDLKRKGVLLTPQEYTSHISDYYNTLISVLVALFVLFTIGTLWGFRFTSRKEIEEAQENIKKDLINELKDSKEFYREIKQEIVGEIADDIVTKEDQSSILKNLEDLNNRQIEMESNINILSETVDSKSEIR